jgi:hypothetical protein
MNCIEPKEELVMLKLPDEVVTSLHLSTNEKVESAAPTTKGISGNVPENPNNSARLNTVPMTG